MKAMILKKFGGVENFSLEEIPEPSVGEDEVLVKIKAIGIDRIDLKTRQGKGMRSYLEQEHPMILGWDISGIVAKTGSRVKNLSVGDEVFGTIRFPGPGSSYAEYAAAPAGQLAKKPAVITHEEAAAATQSPLTAWQALVDIGNVAPGQKVLIHGGAGGVGNYAVQIAHNRGCYVIATASGQDSGFVTGLGADQVIDYRTEQFENEVSDVDFILDTIGGENFIRSLKVLKPDGMIVLLPSDKKEEADHIARENQVRHYRHLLMHSSGEDMKHIADMLASGKLKSFIDQLFPFEQIPQAHTALENGRIKGKIVISTD